mmetsp:Transcript_18360/g.23662  ORF Transcript_18360/g.23662 Transcript_18360/m.23662 type:complete len:133 (+) Transcript_18360:336-734(+)
MKIGCVSVSNVGCLNLKKAHGENFSPYIRVVQGNTVRQTKPVQDLAEFTWPNAWNFVVNELSQATIRFEIKEEVMIGDHPTLGSVTIQMEELINNKGVIDKDWSITDNENKLMDSAKLHVKLDLRIYTGSVR